jgi:hypothetical protein
MKRAMTFLAVMLFPLAALAGETASGTNYFVVDSQSWQTAEKTGYWMWHGNGIQQAVSGPFAGTFPIDCHGAGFWDADGSWGEGICVIGSGDDVRKVHWKRDKGEQIGRWKTLSAIGKFAGKIGQGTYKSTDLPDGRSMSEWEGEYTAAE